MSEPATNDQIAEVKGYLDMTENARLTYVKLTPLEARGIIARLEAEQDRADRAEQVMEMKASCGHPLGCIEVNDEGGEHCIFCRYIEQSEQDLDEADQIIAELEAERQKSLAPEQSSEKGETT
jgi:hypothetical protein